MSSVEVDCHRNGHLKRSVLVQVSALYIAPSSEELYIYIVYDCGKKFRCFYLHVYICMCTFFILTPPHHHTLTPSQICDDKNIRAYLMADMAHISGLVAAGVSPHPHHPHTITRSHLHSCTQVRLTCVTWLPRRPTRRYGDRERE